MKSIVIWAGLTLLGGVGCDVYYRWMFKNSIHVNEFQNFGLLGYWFILVFPGVALLLVLTSCASRLDRRFRFGLLVASVLTSGLIPLFILLGPFLFCVTFTHGVCE